MTRFGKKWRDGMAARFDGRELLPFDHLYGQFLQPHGLKRDPTIELLTTLQNDFGIPAGFLRPDDKLPDVFAPVPSRLPWQWMAFQTRAADLELELQERIDERSRIICGSLCRIETTERAR